VAVAALVAGLIVWSPWTPGTPSAVRVTAMTPTTAQVTWSRPGGIASPDRYLVLRDSVQVADIPANATSWTDRGLAPGITYAYTVIAKAWLQSRPSAGATVTTPAPSPAGVAVSQVTYSTVTLHWSRPRLAPVPDLYEIYNGPELIDTIEGTVTSYTDAKQYPGDFFQYSVVAQWGNQKSKPSRQAEGTLLDAPVTNSVSVKAVTTSYPGYGASLYVGYRWDDIWLFEPSCAGDSCKILATIDVHWTPGQASIPYPVPLTGSGSTYSGSVQVPKSGHCKQLMLTDTITLTINRKGAVRHGSWQGWTGTLVVSTPAAYPSANYSCYAGSWTFAITSMNLRRARADAPVATKSSLQPQAKIAGNKRLIFPLL
jgi:hypothetical protein